MADQKRQLTKKQLGLSGLVAVLIITALFWGQGLLHKEQRGLFPSLAETEFSLVTHEGRTLTNDDLIGRPTAIYFGFTWCPDICPTTLSLMADIKTELQAHSEADAKTLQLVFFSVDPERDTVFQMNEYLSLFDADIIGITGPKETVEESLRRFGIYAKRIDTSDEDYLIDHSASVYLYHANGQFKGTISPAEPYEMAYAKLQRLIGLSDE